MDSNESSKDVRNLLWEAASINPIHGREANEKLQSMDSTSFPLLIAMLKDGGSIIGHKALETLQLFIEKYPDFDWMGQMPDLMHSLESLDNLEFARSRVLDLVLSIERKHPGCIDDSYLDNLSPCLESVSGVEFSSACSIITCMGVPAGIKLVERIKDGGGKWGEEESAKALDTLIKTHPEADWSPILPDLVSLLGHSDDKVRDYMTDALCSLRSKSVPFLCKALRDPNALVRYHAAISAKSIARSDSYEAARGLVLDLILAMGGDDRQAATKACRALEVIGQAALPDLAVSINHTNPLIRKGSSAAIAQIVRDLNASSIPPDDWKRLIPTLTYALQGGNFEFITSQLLIAERQYPGIVNLGMVANSLRGAISDFSGAEKEKAQKDAATCYTRICAAVANSKERWNIDGTVSLGSIRPPSCAGKAKPMFRTGDGLARIRA